MRGETILGTRLWGAAPSPAKGCALGSHGNSSHIGCADFGGANTCAAEFIPDGIAPRILVVRVLFWIRISVILRMTGR